MANTIAELLVHWRNFRHDLVDGLKDMGQVAKSVRAEVSLSPIRQYAKDIAAKNAILRESFSSLENRIGQIKVAIRNSTNAKDIEVLTKNLELMNKAAAKHPGQMARGGYKKGDEKKEESGGLLSSVGGFFKKMNPVYKTVSKFLKAGDKDDDKEKTSLADAAKKDEKGDGKPKGLKGKYDAAVGEVAGAFGPLMDKVDKFGSQLIDGLLPKVLVFAQPIVDLFEKLPFDAILTDVMNVATALMGAVGPIIEELKPLFDSLFESFAPILSSVGGLIVALANGLGPILAAVAHIASAILGPVIKGLAKVFSWIIDVFTGMVKIVSPIIEWLTDIIGWIVDGLAKFFHLDNEKNGTLQPSNESEKFFDRQKKKSSVSVTDAAAQKETGLAKSAGTTPVKSAEGESHANKAAGDITSGGPRVININGVKFTDKIELHILSAKEGLSELEAHMQEMFLRILNSGAALQ